MTWMDKNWKYKDYNLTIDISAENGTLKASHLYVNDATSKIAAISPYDHDSRTFELFIDCIEAGADPKGSFVTSLKGKARYSDWDKKSLQDYAIKFIIDGKSRY